MTTLDCKVIRPSQLTDHEVGAWRDMLAATPHLQRAFFTPSFARACEAVGYRAWVAVLTEGRTIRAFLPFQFASLQHQLIGLAERIGGDMCDNAGLIAVPDFTIDPTALLRLCNISRFFITHLVDGQDNFGLTSDSSRGGYQTVLDHGSDAYFASLDKAFVQDTNRRLRRAEKEYGALRFQFEMGPSPEVIDALLARKREQYQRTGVPDSLADPRRIQLIHELAKINAPECRVVVTELLGDRWLAGHLGLWHNGVLSYWFPVYEPDAKKVSPGRLLLWHTLQNADDLGLWMIDRSEGDTPAKKEFATQLTPFGRDVWSAGTLRGTIARVWQGVEWKLAERAAA